MFKVSAVRGYDGRKQGLRPALLWPALARVRPLLLMAWAVFVGMAGNGFPQAAKRELLNSERIEQEFGSYGIDIISAADGVRVSNLYSTTDGVRTCRTFAVVRFPAVIDPAVAKEHAAIAAGGSMGAVFAANGWQVGKTHLYYGEIEATPTLAKYMRLPPGIALAEHVYAFDVSKDGRTVEYAALVEIHHPEYLRRDELEVIYGPASLGARGVLLASLLATAAAQAER